VTVDVGKRIAKWREAKGLTQQDLARAVGVTHAAVYQWESDDADTHTTPSLENLEKVAAAFGVTLAKFYGPVPKKRRSAS